MNTSKLLPAAAGLVLLPLCASADSGFYIGGSAGGATLEAEIGATTLTPALSFEEDDTALKIFGGYVFDLPAVNLAIEAGYVDFGEPEVATNVGDFRLDTTGLNLWGIAGFEAGPVDLYAKLGYIAWDVDVSADFVAGSQSEDGTDLGYGVGIGFNIGSVQIRGEYEMYDLDDADLSMLSLGLVYRF